MLAGRRRRSRPRHLHLQATALPAPPPPAPRRAGSAGTLDELLERVRADAERRAIAAALARHGNDTRRTADALRPRLPRARGADAPARAAAPTDAGRATRWASARPLSRGDADAAARLRSSRADTSVSVVRRAGAGGSDEVQPAVHDLLVAADRGRATSARRSVGDRGQRAQAVEQRGRPARSSPAASRRAPTPSASATQHAVARPPRRGGSAGSRSMASSAWPAVWPKLRMRRRPASRSSAETTSALMRQHVGHDRRPARRRAASKHRRRAARRAGRTAAALGDDAVLDDLVEPGAELAARQRGQHLGIDDDERAAGGTRRSGSCRAAWLTPTLPPIALSTCASSVVGTCTRRMPRRYVAAAKPARSPTTPPPKATTTAPRSAPRVDAARRRRGRPSRSVLARSPSGTRIGSRCRGRPRG